MKLTAIAFAALTLVLVTSNASARDCIVIENQAGKSYIKNNCSYKVKISACKGKCKAATPRALMSPGGRKFVGTIYDEIHYRWCH